MRSEKNQQTEAARKTKMNERTRRRRNSSRCSRKDICPPSSSSLFLLVDSALMIADIANELYPILFSYWLEWWKFARSGGCFVCFRKRFGGGTSRYNQLGISGFNNRFRYTFFFQGRLRLFRWKNRIFSFEIEFGSFHRDFAFPGALEIV